METLGNLRIVTRLTVRLRVRLSDVQIALEPIEEEEGETEKQSEPGY